MRGSFALSSSALGAVTIVACATAGGELTPGTEKFDAAPPPAPGQGACTIESGSGEKFSDLYRDLFGPTGQPGSCSLQSNCHANKDQTGAKVSNGFVCGANKDECRSTMIDTGLLTPDDAAAPEKSSLVGILRTRNPDGSSKGIMPQEPKGCVFTNASITRITKWIANGFPND